MNVILANRMLSFCEGADFELRKKIGAAFRILDEEKIEEILKRFTSWKYLGLAYVASGQSGTLTTYIIAFAFSNGACPETQKAVAAAFQKMEEKKIKIVLRKFKTFLQVETSYAQTQEKDLSLAEFIIKSAG